MPAGEFTIVRCFMPGVEAIAACSRRSFARHTHDTFGIGIVEAGGQLSQSGRGQVEAGPGDVITVNPGEVHDGAPVGSTERAWRIVYLEPGIVQEANSHLRRSGSADFELTRPVLRAPRVARLVRGLFAAATSEVPAMAREQSLLAALAALGAPPARRESSPPRPEIERARCLIDDNPAANVTLAALAEVSGLSRFQVLRGFVRVTGLTPHAYLVQRRADRVRRLIAGGAALADAAAAAGFADQSHMTRVFTSRYGITPGAYAAALR